MAGAAGTERTGFVAAGGRFVAVWVGRIGLIFIIIVIAGMFAAEPADNMPLVLVCCAGAAGSVRYLGYRVWIRRVGLSISLVCAGIGCTLIGVVLNAGDMRSMRFGLTLTATGFFAAAACGWAEPNAVAEPLAAMRSRLKRLAGRDAVRGRGG